MEYVVPAGVADPYHSAVTPALCLPSHAPSTRFLMTKKNPTAPRLTGRGILIPTPPGVPVVAVVAAAPGACGLSISACGLTALACCCCVNWTPVLPSGNCRTLVNRGTVPPVPPPPLMVATNGLGKGLPVASPPADP